MLLMDKESVAIFLESCDEHLDNIEQQLLDLEAAEEEAIPSILDEIFRSAHSIKGDAKCMKLPQVEELAHDMENVLQIIRERKVRPEKTLVTAMLAANDRLRALVHSTTAER